jgi:hypothetical protein
MVAAMVLANILLCESSIFVFLSFMLKESHGEIWFSISDKDPEG